MIIKTKFPFSPSSTPSTLTNLTLQLPPTTTRSRVAEQTCLTLLNSCTTLTTLTQIHTLILKLGLINNPLVLTKFAATSSTFNAIHYATSFLFSDDPTTAPRASSFDAFLFNTLIRAFAHTPQSKSSGLQLYRTMLRYGVVPNKFTYPFVLKACAGLSDLRLGKAVHGSVVKFGFDDDLHVQNTMIHMYCCCCCGSGEGKEEGEGVELAGKVFDESPKTDSVTWSAMIGGYARRGHSSRAVGLFREMQVMGVCPDEITMVSVLTACADLGALELGKWLESYIEWKKIPKSVELCNALIDMFAKCGDVDKAMNLFRQMDSCTIVSWTSVIVGLAMHGRGSEAVSLFDEMVEQGVEPDDVSFIGVLSACCHSKLVDKGRSYFNSMEGNFGIVPKIEHYGCMVDLLSRAGFVKEALDFVRTMPVEPNQIIWRSIITACHARGELKLGESISKELLRNEPTHESNYVLLSNIYAKLRRWEQKTKVREMMDMRGMKKVPGSTMIELNNEMCEFVAGDKSHDQYKQIYEMVDEMGREIKRAGYVPTTSQVLLDIDEEDKEDALYKHSEKLAIAFALLNTPPGTPIRIVKNLRVCEDCHSATKFISKVYNREIVVRDRNRFHHFKNGLCSCGDFW
ncbi:pentatricopeptide repeat-containing protein At4g21065-like [Lotus japonicus]|uniref:pentatricopeptide repeat-containing protein At4g21065-like n=1 Tax=Lotus japonicus TaxID=34305 RepID=UPI00258E93E7|nr:pentatricopeptide repeat-containing protein At4g21065-like [Lotus japonicus]